MISIATVVASSFVSAEELSPCTDSYDFIAIGDMPYHLPMDWERMENIITDINDAKPAFTVHVGDIKSAKSPCSDEYYDKIYRCFSRFEGPLIYTPGDNEWTDCHTSEAGTYEPVERLDALRKVFFVDDYSLGRHPIQLATQRQDPYFGKYVENARWRKGGVVFATVHMTGSNNSHRPDRPEALEEFVERDAANEVWIRRAFAIANDESAKGIVLFMQAAPFGRDPRQTPASGFRNFLKVLSEETLKFERPVMLIQGDQHFFVLDKPLRNPANGRLVENFTRLQVFGEEDMHGVRITVNPSSPRLFSVQEFLVEKNMQTYDSTPR